MFSIQLLKGHDRIVLDPDAGERQPVIRPAKNAKLSSGLFMSAEPFFSKATRHQDQNKSLPERHDPR
jgi:hypothetical protein